MTTLTLNTRQATLDGERIGFYTLSPKHRGKRSMRPAIKARPIMRWVYAILWVRWGVLPEIN